MLTKKVTGIILNNQPYLELDRRLIVFSHEYGILHILAKGVRKITSRRAGHLDLFNLAKMEIEECGNGPNRMGYLREITTTKPYRKMKTNSYNFSAACLISLFLRKILPEGAAQEAVFDLTCATFEALNEGRECKKILFAYFLKVMRTLGLLPETLPQKNARQILFKALLNIDPQFTLNARRTLEIFSRL